MGPFPTYGTSLGPLAFPSLGLQTARILQYLVFHTWPLYFFMYFFSLDISCRKQCGGKPTLDGLYHGASYGTPWSAVSFSVEWRTPQSWEVWKKSMTMSLDKASGQCAADVSPSDWPCSVQLFTSFASCSSQRSLLRLIPVTAKGMGSFFRLWQYSVTWL